MVLVFSNQGLFRQRDERLLLSPRVGIPVHGNLAQQLRALLFRLAVFVIGALITGVMVAFSGIIGFVGLMVPHIARMLVGGDYTRVLLASALIGAIFLLWADILARTLMAPEDMPIGIVTGLIGGVFFIWLLSRRNI